MEIFVLLMLLALFISAARYAIAYWRLKAIERDSARSAARLAELRSSELGRALPYHHACSAPALERRWKAIKEEIALHGKPLSVPAWWADDATPSQHERLLDDGFYPPGDFTKGQCSDLISLTSTPPQSDLDILRMFNIEPKTNNQFDVREQMREIFSDPANRERWREETH